MNWILSRTQKTRICLLLAICLLTWGAAVSDISFARITSPANNGDIWCAGPSGAEACIDSTGGVIPTTTNDADLGTSSLLWKALHITAGGLTDASVANADIANLAIQSAKLAVLSVDSEKLAGNAVNSEKIQTLAVQKGHLAVGAVETDRLASGSVNTQKILRDAIQTSKLMWGSVGPDSGKIICIRGGNTGGFGVCSNSASIHVDGCGNCE
ncbi:MAG: hypothetical protein QME60_01305 [Verrucomicrobiota bacterium]|nr:hypothetical protein [Verrucomicrobiota bacterium]